MDFTFNEDQLALRDSVSRFLMNEAAPELLRIVEQAALVDQLQDENASHERARIGRDLHDSAIQPYLGLKYAVEALARRRCAEAFAANGVSADQIFVNVQALSGAPANNAVYHALVEPGDTVMGMNLFHGGHLTHGSPANRSGQYYHIVSYSVDPHNEQINYDDVMALAREHKPKMIICGYSSYPWIPD